MNKTCYIAATCLFVYLLTYTNCFSQTPDLSGHWNGVTTISLAQNLQNEYFFEQEGALLSGYVTSRSLNLRDSSKFLFTGTISSEVVQLKSTEFVYRTGTACLSNIDFTYSRNNGEEKLTGKWYGDWSMKTCPPGVSGKVELIKIQEPLVAETEFNSQVVGTIEVAPEDKFGKLMIKELQKRKYYALFIGINEYGDPEIDRLEYPIKDARDLENVLLSQYSFQQEYTTTLSNPTRDQIIETFDMLSEVVTSDDLLFIFYAGHGVWNEKMQQGYWLPADASHSSRARWLSNGTIRDYIAGIDAKHTLLVTDACFGGAIFRERAVTFSEGKAMLELFKLTSRKAMTSGTLTTVPDKSVFIKYLIQNLSTNKKPLLSADQLFRGFKVAVINNSVNGQVPQYGSIGQTGDEGGDFIFLRRIGD